MSTQPGTGTSEVSKKLKFQAAIRAKLEELGVYVDDELPDYIMVMIANKKEKVQMKDDLNLFIGKSTAKFVDWLFDLFDRLQNASNKQGESSKKDEENLKEQQEKEAKEQEEKRRKEKEEREKEQQKEKEREREKERQRERDREKRLEEEKRREEKRKEAQRPKHRRIRSRSNTYSDDEERVHKTDRHQKDARGRKPRSAERRRINAIEGRQESASPEKKLQSQVQVKRNIRPTGDTNVKGRGTMFLRAMNEASVSAGYGASRKDSQEEAHDDDDMSDVEALPSKVTKSPKKSIRERLSRVNKGVVEPLDDDTVVLGNQPQSGGPQMILKLSGGKEAIKKTRIQDRIVVDDNLRRGLLKRRIETPGASEEPKSKHERIKFDISQSRDSTPTDDSPTMQKWNGQISLGDDSEESDNEEAEIDAFVAEARGIVRRDSVMEEDEIPPTHQLSGAAYPIHITDGYPSSVPTYIPTPLSVLNEQQNQMSGPKDHHTKERCVFWPKCTKGDMCAFIHPTTPCKNFPNCTYGIRCLFIHPPCRFDRFCTKKHCPFTHHGTGGHQPGTAPEMKNPLTSNRISPSTPTGSAPSEDAPKPPRGALGSLAEKLAASIKKKNPVVKADATEEKTDENDTEKVESNNEEGKEESMSPPSSATTKTFPDSNFRFQPLQNMIPCRYAAACRNPVCHFKHPKECRFGANCRNSACYFYHKPGAPAAPIAAPVSADSSTAAKYKWTATAN